MTYRYDRNGRIVSRIITAQGWITTQVPQPNGEWWNIAIRRVGS